MAKEERKMGGHEEHHEEDSSVPLKVGIFMICMFVIIAAIAVL